MWWGKECLTNLRTQVRLLNELITSVRLLNELEKFSSITKRAEQFSSFARSEDNASFIMSFSRCLFEIFCQEVFIAFAMDAC